ncbi:hypothetical protein KSC_040450 [Ktedonobacter sp. SOSP1-52]|nr:hypothetical protein KSC_040450 [Ktedonobacter sp. SOSP1-52]
MSLFVYTCLDNVKLTIALYEKLGFIEKEQKLVYMVFSWNYSQRYSHNGYLIPTYNGSFSQATFMIKSPLNDTIEAAKDS